MKLVIAIVQDKDANRAVETLVAGGFRATRINTAGGFWKRGNATLLVGVDDGEVSTACELLRKSCAEPTLGPEGAAASGVVFVLPVKETIKL